MKRWCTYKSSPKEGFNTSWQREDLKPWGARKGCPRKEDTTSTSTIMTNTRGHENEQVWSSWSWLGQRKMGASITSYIQRTHKPLHYSWTWRSRRVIMDFPYVFERLPTLSSYYLRHIETLHDTWCAWQETSLVVVFTRIL